VASLSLLDLYQQLVGDMADLVKTLVNQGGRVVEVDRAEPVVQELLEKEMLEERQHTAQVEVVPAL
jgi:hypothetical protein